MLNFFRNSSLREVFEDVPIVAIDIGSRGGIEPDLLPIAWATLAWGFEPDPEAFARLRCIDPKPWREVNYLPLAIAGRSGERTLFIPRSPVGASLLEHDPRIGETFAHGDLFAVERTASVTTVELDRAISECNIPQPAFIKLDVEGAELEILEGGVAALENTVAVKAEVAFIPQRKGQPLAADIESFLAKQGFVLMDFISPHRWRRYSTTPSPYVSRDRLPFSAGQLVQGDYLFFRDPDELGTDSEEDILQNIRAALMALCYGYFDHAYALMSRERVRVFLEKRYSLDVASSIERSSRFYGRQISKRTALAHLRDLIPLMRSLARTYLR